MITASGVHGYGDSCPVGPTYEQTHAMGVIARFAVDEMMGSEGLEWESEGREALEMLAEVRH